MIKGRDAAGWAKRMQMKINERDISDIGGEGDLRRKRGSHQNLGGDPADRWVFSNISLVWTQI